MSTRHLSKAPNLLNVLPIALTKVFLEIKVPCVTQNFRFHFAFDSAEWRARVSLQKKLLIIKDRL